METELKRRLMSVTDVLNVPTLLHKKVTDVFTLSASTNDSNPQTVRTD
jgi:hypothetical protein